MKKLRLVKVQWQDIIREDSWTDVKDIDKEFAKRAKEKFFSTGWLYHRDLHGFVVLFTSMNYDDKGELEQVSWEVIPVGCVVKIVTVE